MTAAERWDELEARLHRLGIAAPEVAAVMALAGAFARAHAREAAGRRTRAVHYAPSGHPACLPDGRSVQDLEVTPGPAGVTCRRCRRTPGWLEANAGLAVPPAVHYDPSGDARAACDSRAPGPSAAMTGDPQAVSCGSCRHTLAWREASGARP